LDYPVVIVDYDPRWPALYGAERARILEAVGEWVVALEHIGSTAVPGLAAKPIIDLMGGVRRLADVTPYIPPLRALGYRYVPDFEDVLPERRYFYKGDAQAHTYHLHIVERTDDFWRRHILFRDFLRAHPERMSAYDRLKRDLAARLGADREAYTEAKTAFIEAVVVEARRWRDEEPRTGSKIA
jgi:GrpB-like predicted nucleotidyltransferase (UPF0157 family)